MKTVHKRIVREIFLKKRLVSLCLTLVTICGSLFMFTISASATTYNMDDLAGKYKTQGRTLLKNGTLMLDWSASGIEFNANCSGDVSILVDTQRLENRESRGGIYFTVVVDGVVKEQSKRVPQNNSATSWTSNSTNYPFHITNTGTSSFVIARGLSSGNHSFAIYNQTEALDGAFGIKSITLNGNFTELPQNSDLYVEYIGDSIAVGLGNLSTGGNRAPLYQDATKSFPYLTSKLLGADWSVIGQSGITACKGMGWQGANSVSMQDVYPRYRYYSDKNSSYPFSRQADVVVVCLGTNDMWTYSSSGKTQDDIRSGFRNTINLIKSKNPNAKIIWLYGMMINDADSIIEQAIADLGGSASNNYTLKLEKNTSGGQGHPSASAHINYAIKLSSFINKLLNRSSSIDISGIITGGNDTTTGGNDTTTGGNDTTTGLTSSKNITSSKSGGIKGVTTKQNSSDASNKEGESTVSNNNYISSLSVKGYKLSPKFNPDVLEYTVFISYDLEKVDIDFKPSSNFAEMKISGVTNLKAGVNSTAEILCNGADGSSITYILKLNRLKENTKKKNIVPYIIGGSAAIVILAGASVLTIILLKKKRKTQNTQPSVTDGIE